MKLIKLNKMKKLLLLLAFPLRVECN